MTAIDDRAAQLGTDLLGAALSDEIELGAGCKLKAFYAATLLEVPGAGVYTLAEATVAPLFVPKPNGPAPPAGSRLVRGMDVSSHQSRDLTALIRVYEPSHVVCKLYQEMESIPQSCTIQQLQSAQANGCTVGGYVWLYHSVSPGGQVHEALDVAERAGVTLPILWIDLETYEGAAPTLAEAEMACAECDRLGQPVGLYTGDWFVRDYWHGQIGSLANRPVWLATYDGLENLEPPSAFWPREMVKGKQYTSSPVDLNAFAREVTEPPA